MYVLIKVKVNVTVKGSLLRRRLLNVTIKANVIERLLLWKVHVTVKVLLIR